MSINQDISTPSGSLSGYITMSVKIGSTVVGQQLIKETGHTGGTSYDSIHLATVVSVNADNIISVHIQKGANGITYIDNGAWGNYNFIWTSQ